jgi:hypothetical protein
MQSQFPDLNIKDLLDVDHLKQMPVLDSTTGIGFASDLVRIIRSDYLVQNHVVEGFLVGETHNAQITDAQNLNQTNLPLNDYTVSNNPYFLRTVNTAGDSQLDGQADNGFYPAPHSYQSYTQELIGDRTTNVPSGTEAKEFGELNFLDFLQKLAYGTSPALSWNAIDAQNATHPSGTHIPSFANQILTPLSFIPQSLQSAYASFADSILQTGNDASSTGFQDLKTALDNFSNPIYDISDPLNIQIANLLQYDLYLRALSKDNQTLVSAGKFQASYGFLVSKDDAVAIPNLTSDDWAFIDEELQNALPLTLTNANLSQGILNDALETIDEIIDSASIKGYIKLGDYQDNTLSMDHAGLNDSILGGFGNDTITILMAEREMTHCKVMVAMTVLLAVMATIP